MLRAHQLRRRMLRDRGTIPRARVVLALIYFSRETKHGTDRWLKPERFTPKVRRVDNIDRLF